MGVLDGWGTFEHIFMMYEWARYTTYIVEFTVKEKSRLSATKIYVLYNSDTQYVYKYALSLGTYTYVEQISLSRVPHTNTLVVKFLATMCRAHTNTCFVVFTFL